MKVFYSFPKEGSDADGANYFDEMEKEITFT